MVTARARTPGWRFRHRRLDSRATRPRPAFPRSPMPLVRTAPPLVGSVAALAALVSSACAQDAGAGAAASAMPVAEVSGAGPRVTLETTLGDIELALDAARAPVTVENFLGYVDDGFYDGTVFHRVIEGFMIQGGGFDADLARRETRAPIRNEADNGLANRRYTIAMARTNAPHSASSQFFVNVADNRNLDHTAPTPRGWGYAVFGEVVDGREVVDRIAEVPTGAGGPFGGDVPLEPVVIERAARVPVPGEPVPDESVPGESASDGPASGDAVDASAAATPENALPGLPAAARPAGAN